MKKKGRSLYVTLSLYSKTGYCIDLMATIFNSITPYIHKLEQLQTNLNSRGQFYG